MIVVVAAVLGGKLAAEVVASRAAGLPVGNDKVIQQSVLDRAAKYTAKEPIGVLGDGAITFGGGAVLTNDAKELLVGSDPAQLVKMG